MAPVKFEWNFRHVIFKQILVIDGCSISCKIALIIWMSLDFTDDQSTLVQVMARCRQASSHYLSQCWPRSLSPYGFTRTQWVNAYLNLDIFSNHYLQRQGQALVIWLIIQFWWTFHNEKHWHTFISYVALYGSPFPITIYAGIILCMHPANDRWHYIITSSLIGWAHSQNYPCSSQDYSFHSDLISRHEVDTKLYTNHESTAVVTAKTL